MAGGRIYGDFRIGLGGVILFVNAFLLTGYSLSCHSLRHIVGGRLDCFSCSASRHGAPVLWQQIVARPPASHGMGIG